MNLGFNELWTRDAFVLGFGEANLGFVQPLEKRDSPRVYLGFDKPLEKRDSPRVDLGFYEPLEKRDSSRENLGFEEPVNMRPGMPPSWVFSGLTKGRPWV